MNDLAIQFKSRVGVQSPLALFLPLVVCCIENFQSEQSNGVVVAWSGSGLLKFDPHFALSYLLLETSDQSRHNQASHDNAIGHIWQTGANLRMGVLSTVQQSAALVARSISFEGLLNVHYPELEIVGAEAKGEEERKDNGVDSKETKEEEEEKAKTERTKKYDRLGKRRDEDDGDSCPLLVVTMFSK
ncbi:hypothetical protein DAPPUDRAFT_254097 [Daphnia pulex]|uniref:Uncharacterized protein n=1 Tax=Daphnia pulex TaxID=6669 RepID=E9H6A0_DAPPU|nr:hypothetical protein DAPPUDRAFT_254097 [Daphnia pulex]|eukprot:EFX72732.1 hypothetical protein DAPPUDRAFT_254097 [Daphnia pulex]